MKIRITFRSECYVEGDSMAEIRDKYETTNIYSEEFLENLDGDFVETMTVEDADTYEDKSSEYFHCYD